MREMTGRGARKTRLTISALVWLNFGKLNETCSHEICSTPPGTVLKYGFGFPNLLQPATVLSPIVVVVPAASRSPELYEFFTAAPAASPVTSRMVPLPFVGASSGLKDCIADIELIRKRVIVVVEAGEDVIVLLRSYGGIPGSATPKGLCKGQRAKMVKRRYSAIWSMQTVIT